MSVSIRLLLLAAALTGAVAACQRQPPADAPVAAASRPVDAVLLPARHLRDNDLSAFVRDAVPPALHERLGTAWREDRGRWPLDELPLHEQLPSLLAALSADDAQAQLQQAFRQQLAGAEGELRQAADTLGLFGVHYVQNDDSLDEDARERYIQLIEALGRWAREAPLADPARADAAIARLVAAARATGLDSDAAFGEAGMDESLRRLSPFLAAAKRVLAGYGLDIDDSLDGIDATLERQTGDRARLRVRYQVAGHPIDTRIEVERRDGRWYRSDYLRHAEAAAAGPAQQAPPPAPRPDGA